MTLTQALMNSFECDIEEATRMLMDMRNEVWEQGRNPEDVLEDYGLEPDYFFDLVD